MRTICVSQRGRTTPGVWGTDPLELTISLVEKYINVVAGVRSARTLCGSRFRSDQGAARIRGGRC